MYTSGENVWTDWHHQRVAYHVSPQQWSLATAPLVDQNGSVPLRRTMRRTLCVVLDLDQTLVHTTPFQRHQRYDQVIEYRDARVRDVEGVPRTSSWYGMNVRAHASELLRYLGRTAMVAVYTSGTREYARLVVDLLAMDVPDSRIWSREHCEQDAIFSKRLDPLLAHHALDASNVVFIDDNLQSTRNCRRYLLPVPPFCSHVDSVCRELVLVLEQLRGVLDLHESLQELRQKMLTVGGAPSS